MSMNLGKRIRAIRGKLSQDAFGKKLGVSVQAVSQWENGKTRPTPDKFELMHKEFGADLSRLIPDGTPECQNVETLVSSIDGQIGRPRPDEIVEAEVRSGAGGGGLRDYDLVVYDHNGNTYAAESVAGLWRIPEAVTSGLLHATPTNLLCFEVIGDSMEPRLHSGDRVFVDTRDRFPNPEGIFVLWDGYSTVVKRVQIVRGSDPVKLKIISANEQYDPYEILADDAKIIGRFAGRFTVE